MLIAVSLYRQVKKSTYKSLWWFMRCKCCNTTLSQKDMRESEEEELGVDGDLCWRCISKSDNTEVIKESLRREECSNTLETESVLSVPQMEAVLGYD